MTSNDCDHDNVTSEKAYLERPEGSFPMGVVGVCNDCGGALILTGEPDEEGHPTWELDWTNEELVQIRRQSHA
jgi:hypothetical protein